MAKKAMAQSAYRAFVRDYFRGLQEALKVAQPVDDEPWLMEVRIQDYLPQIRLRWKFIGKWLATP